MTAIPSYPNLYATDLSQNFCVLILNFTPISQTVFSHSDTLVR